MIFTILERDHIAVGGISKNFQNIAGKNPVMSVQNSRTWFDDDSSHAVMMSHLWPSLYNPFSIFLESKSCGAGKYEKFLISGKRCYLSRPIASLRCTSFCRIRFPIRL